MNRIEHVEQAGKLLRLRRLLEKPAREKFASFYGRWTRVFPAIPVPIRLPFGAWFLARNDYVGAALVYGGFEAAEQAFLQSSLKRGMTVLDIGAHQGVHTLLASKMVGAEGRVFSFEPSPRERRALRRNVTLNRCKNVRIEGIALGGEETEAVLYVVHHRQTGCNSLRQPAVEEPVSQIKVRVRRLDRWLEEKGLRQVDFVKLDVEGGELGVLQGAEQLLRRVPRPLILAEVQDIRTAPWGYPAKAIVQHLASRGFSWFSVMANGSVRSMDAGAETYDGNFVACPEERCRVLTDGLSHETIQQVSLSNQNS
jgi:FkbM family methyltransferase